MLFYVSVEIILQRGELNGRRYEHFVKAFKEAEVAETSTIGALLPFQVSLQGVSVQKRSRRRARETRASGRGGSLAAQAASDKSAPASAKLMRWECGGREEDALTFASD